jgi:uncharacterized protein (TIGR03435 family)
MYRLSWAISVSWAAAPGLVRSQDRLAETFEVASIKPSGAQSVRGWEGGLGTKDPGRYHFGLAAPLDLIMVAYHVDPFQISSKTPLTQPQFDLDAKTPPGATKEQFRAMMQNLLAERFHLKMHIESKEFPGYELVVSKTALKLTDAAGSSGPETTRPARDEGFPVLPPGRPGMAATMSDSGDYILIRMRSRRQPVSALARMISVPDEPPVADKTGLTGTYDFTLEYTREPRGVTPVDAPPPAAPDLFQALQQQLGLQLVAKKLPFDVVVIDSIDKMPTAN